MKPKPLVALNHFTVPMLTGVVPSQDRYSRSPLSNGLVRSNFWKGRQRLNRLYRWLANVVRPKIDLAILWEAGPQNNPEAHDFLIETNCRCAHLTAWPAAMRVGKSRLNGGGIDRAVAHPAGPTSRSDARPCGGISSAPSPGRRGTSRLSPGHR